jgi:hypothetical protein
MSFVKAFARFWYDFIVGEDWRIAAGVAAVLGAGAVGASTGAVGDALLVVLVTGAIAVVVVASVVLETRRAEGVAGPEPGTPGGDT